MTATRAIDRIRRDCQALDDWDVLLYGSVLTDTFTPHSDIDVAVVTRTRDPDENRQIWFRLLGRVPDRYDVRVFELLPLNVQADIIENHQVVYGTPVDISYYLYKSWRRWKDQAPRHHANRFRSFEEKRRALADAKT